MKKVNGVAVFFALTAIVLGGCKTGNEMHEHDFASEWTNDASYHWHTAICEHADEVSGKTAHSFGHWTLIKDATETEKGSRERVCTVCGYKVTEEIDLLPHTHKFSSEWQSSETHHWQAAICEHTQETGGNSVHIWDNGIVKTSATCTTEGVKSYTCTVCKRSKTETIPAGHIWDTIVDVKATAFADGIKKEKCKVCNEEKTETLKKLDTVSLNTLGALKVLEYTELDKYGITDTSVPARVLNATYVTFGVYPQTIKDSTVKIADGSDSTVNNGTAVENQEIICTGTKYYLGTDGNWYVKATENAYENGYKYSDNTDVAQSSANSEKWFKVEPILWRVLKDDVENNKYMLLAEKILTANVPYYGTTSSNRNTNNYAYSNIRAYLNGIKNGYATQIGSANIYDIDWTNKGFLQQAFTATQQAKIADTDVDNSVASTKDSSGSFNSSNTYSCSNTTDKIFLLSELEATTSTYGFEAYNATENSRKRLSTDYAKANFCDAKDGSNWMLRSPYKLSSSTYYVCTVNKDGKTNGPSNKHEEFGVVPALCVTK